MPPGTVPLRVRPNSHQRQGDDAVTREPIEGVSVRLAKAQAGTITGSAGTFSLSSSHTANSLVISYIGYTTQKLPLTDDY